MDLLRAIRRCFLMFVVALLLPLHADASEEDSTAAFASLSALVGDWEGKFDDGRRHTVSYRLSAGGTVLVETWALAPGRESLTLYHRDGADLVAVHYCPQGTQPRLQLAGMKHGRMDFEFDGGSSLKEPGRSHQHSMWIQIDSADAFVRSETYVENGASADDIAKAEAGSAIRYTRIAPAM